jgi:Uma2 family endonuclease
MTLLREQEAQRFIFTNADWSFFEEISRRVEHRRAFVTYYKGKLEVVTTSFLHERIAFLLATMIRVLAEETDTPLVTAGRATLRDPAQDEGVEADAAFYIKHAVDMREKEEIDLTDDPPPDLAIEVEVTRRLGERQTIYRDLGVPEVWRYSETGLTILLRRGADYQSGERSEAFPQLSPQELFGFIASGISQDETPWVKLFRRRVQQAIAS